MLIEPMLRYVFEVHVFMCLSDIQMPKHFLNVYEFLYSISRTHLHLQAQYVCLQSLEAKLGTHHKTKKV